jgi:ribose/xylose/arabinose/galactoside ABC-type transport system permease subunit
MTAPAASAGSDRGGLADVLRSRGTEVQQLALLAFLVFEIVVFTIITPSFFSGSNFLNIGTAISILLIVSVGATFGLISGAIDLSVASVVALAGTVATQLALQGWQTPWLILAALLVGLGIGLTNGFVVVKLRVNPIVATLAMLGIARGFAFIVDGGAGAVGRVRVFPEGFDLMQGRIGGVPLPLIFAIGVLVIGGLLLRYTRFGRYAYAVGGNSSSSRSAALPVDRLRIAYLALTGMLAGLAGWVFASMVNGVSSGVAAGLELRVFSAVILGGVALAGGRGSMVGTLIGVIIIGVMVNGLTLAGVPVFWQLMGQGLVLLAAVALDAARTGGYR